MTKEELQDWMALVHRRLTRIEKTSKGWPSGKCIDFTPEEAKAILRALEIAGDL